MFPRGPLSYEYDVFYVESYISLYPYISLNDSLDGLL